MVGDGTNDAPALSTATVGIALASHGGGITAEAADIVILADDLGRVAEAVETSRWTLRIARQSIWAGLGMSGVAMVVAAAGYIPPIAGAVLQEVIDVAVILNALRAAQPAPAPSARPRPDTFTRCTGVAMNPQLESFRYDDAIVRKFLWATFVWGLIGMTVGLLIALQLANPAFNFGIPWLSFGRLRPLHTNAVIFAFAGNAFFTGAYYSSQRLLKTRMFSDALSKFHFWGWQLIIVCAALTLPLGFTQAKEYAELEWPIDIADRRGLGRLRDQLLRHHREAPGAAPLRGDLVLHRQHRDRGHPAHLQQPVDPRRPAEELLDLRRRAGRLHAVVVRPQRGGVLPDDAVPRADVLLPAQGGRPADLLLPAVASCTSGRSSSSTSGRGRTTCTTPRSPSGPARWA